VHFSKAFLGMSPAGGFTGVLTVALQVKTPDNPATAPQIFSVPQSWLCQTVSTQVCNALALHCVAPSGEQPVVVGVVGLVFLLPESQPPTNNAMDAKIIKYRFIIPPESC
jgi:hypothetical protein